MSHIDLILTEHTRQEIRLRIVGDALPGGALSERIVIHRDEVDRMSERLSRDLFEWANRPAHLKPGPPVREALARSGLALYQTLFGRTGDLLRNLKDSWAPEERYCLLHLDEELIHLPVELCYDGDAFLSETFLMGRRVAAARADRLTHPHVTDPPRVVLLANPSEDPCLSDSAEEELAGVRRALAESGAPLDVRPYVGRAIDGTVIDENLPGAAVVHFIGHADDVPDRPDRSGWRLFGRRWYGADRVLRLQNPPAVVFANACATARTAEWKRQTLVRAFLERGTLAYVGTWWEVGSPAASRFAATFYRVLTQGMSVGMALARARSGMLDALGPDDVSWASYVLYGDPRIRLPLESGAPAGPRPGRWPLALSAAAAIALAVLLPSTLGRWGDNGEREMQERVAPARGYLTFESVPEGATVRIDGDPRGTTPCTLEMDEGSHEVTLELPGYRVWEAAAIVDPEHPRVIHTALERIP